MITSIGDLAARVRLSITHETMRKLYTIGAVRPDNELEDLAVVIDVLASEAVRHGISLGR